MRNIERRIEKIEQMSGKDLPRYVVFEVIGEGGKVTSEFKIPINYTGGKIPE